MKTLLNNILQTASVMKTALKTNCALRVEGAVCFNREIVVSTAKHETRNRNRKRETQNSKRETENAKLKRETETETRNAKPKRERKPKFETEM